MSLIRFRTCTVSFTLFHFVSVTMTRIFALILCLALKNIHQTKRVDNICSTQHIKRVYLALEESGIITAYNVTITNSGLSNFSSHEGCQVEIVTCPSCIISLTFRYMDLNCYCGLGANLFLHNPCRCDYVWVTEPPFEDSGESFSGVLPLQGSVLNYKSKTRNLRISFFYTRFHTHAFTIDYKSKPNRQFHFGSPQTVNLSTEFIASPFFPAIYPRDLIADYVLSCIRGPDGPSFDGCRVRLIFTDFQLASASVMEFYDGQQRVHAVTGSSFRPPVILTSSDSLTVRFYASGQSNFGFKAAYSFITSDVAKKMMKPATDCGGFVDNFGGTITMMNMVNSEMRSFDCIWLIKPLKNIFNPKTHLYLKVTTFLDFGGDAELQVRQGLTSESPILEKLSHPVSQKFKEHIIPIKSGYYVSLRAVFSPASHFAITYASFSYNRCFILSEFLCRNYRCISKKLTCDGFDHCGDNSDEPNICYQEWDLEPTIGRWHTHTPNYYFPKINDYSDFKTASIVFLVSLFALIFLISALTTLLYRIGTKARRERNLQQQLQTMNELRDSLSDEIYVEDIVIDDPPSYEGPPNYDEVMKLSVALITCSNLQPKNWCDTCRGCQGSTYLGDLTNGREEPHICMNPWIKELPTPSVVLSPQDDAIAVDHEEREEKCTVDGFKES